MYAQWFLRKEYLAHPIHVPKIIKWHFKWQPVLFLTFMLAVLFYHHHFNVVPINPLYKLYDLTQTLKLKLIRVLALIRMKMMAIILSHIANGNWQVFLTWQLTSGGCV